MATILNTNPVYDPRYHTFESWASGIDVFTNEGIPGPFIYDDWQEWAEALVNSVNPAVN